MASAPDSISDEAKAERLLKSLAGVVSAHVVTDPAGEIVEIHILSSPELHPKQVVRNVESALRAGLGFSIDRRIVSVAQIRSPHADTNGRSSGEDTAGRDAAPEEDEGGGLPTDANRAAAADRAAEAPDAGLRADRGRLEYVRFASRRDVEQCTCEVTLRGAGGEFVGSGSGPDTAGGRGEAAARAVLAALEKARPEVRLQLEGAVISSSRGRGFVIVSAHALLERVTVPLAGAAPLTRSPEEAAILATLQATNRWSA